MSTLKGVRTNRVAAWTVALAVALAVGAAPVALAAGAAGIHGTVVNGTTAKPVAGIAVTVTYFDGQGKIGSARVTAADDGTFDVTPPAAAVGYQVSATYQGTDFRAPATQLQAGTAATSTLRVYEATGDPAKVTQTDWVVWIDREGGGFAVQQDFGWSNGGDQAYVGADGVTTTVALASGAASLQFLGTFLEQRGDVTDGAYVSHAPIVPGDSTATIRYTVPSLDRLSLPVSLATQNFELFVPAGITASGTGIRLAGSTTDTTSTGQTVTYQQYVADGLAAGTTLDVTLSAAPADAGGSGGTTGLLLGVAAVALLALAAFWLLGRARARASEETPAPAGRRAPAPQRATVASRRREAAGARNAAEPTGEAGETDEVDEVDDEVDEVDDEVDLLIDEIAALDLSFEQGLLAERTYRRLRVAAKDRLLLARDADQERGARR